MIELTYIRDLIVDNGNDVNHIAAASGIVLIDCAIFVVADDETHVAKFDIDQKGPGRLMPLMAGPLSLDPKQRKREKPDHEAIVLIPPNSQQRFGALLVLPSGSKKHRSKGVLIDLDSANSFATKPKLFDMRSLYEDLERKIPDLNIEGAVIINDQLKLFQRGNGKSQINATIDFDLAEFLMWARVGCLGTAPFFGVAVAPAKKGAVPRQPRILNIQEFELPKIKNVQLSFTDATVTNDHEILFVAAAEDKDSTYLDGPCAGSAVGLIDSDNHMKWVDIVSLPVKLEGICSYPNDATKFLVVSDADDRSQSAKLYELHLPK